MKLFINFFSFFSMALAFIISSYKTENPPEKVKDPLQETICNPLYIEYNFWRAKKNKHNLTQLSYREAADPTVVVVKNEYYLFASHGDSFYVSDNLHHWKFVEFRPIKNTKQHAE